MQKNEKTSQLKATLLVERPTVATLLAEEKAGLHRPPDEDGYASSEQNQSLKKSNIFGLSGDGIWLGRRCYQEEAAKRQAAEALLRDDGRVIRDNSELLEAVLAFVGEHPEMARSKRFVLSLNDTEQNIVEAVGNQRLTGEKIADRAGYPYNSNFKSTLASLVKRKVLVNRIDAEGRGYERADLGQDKGQD